LVCDTANRGRGHRAKANVFPARRPNAHLSKINRLVRFSRLAHPFAAPQNGVAVVHLIITTVLYFGAIALGTLYFGNYAVMALAIVLFTGGGIRYFGAQHDCGHAAHFSNRRVNTVMGVLLGAFTAHPFFAMRYNHNLHHRHIGNLDEREAHEVLTWTVAEYQAASIWGKLFYRTYRSAPVIYFFGPIFIFFFRYRIPKNVSVTGWLDVILQNTVMFGLWAGIYVIGGANAFAFFMIANVFAACFGTFMVYAGHNFEDLSLPDLQFCLPRPAPPLRQNPGLPPQTLPRSLSR